MEIIMAAQTGTNKLWEVRDAIQYDQIIILYMFVCQALCSGL